MTLSAPLHGGPPVRIGIIANPLSARDVRRVLSHATGLNLGERANMLLRLIHVLSAFGIDEVHLMPEREGLRALLERQLERSRTQPRYPLPRIIWLDMPVRGNIQDTFLAARLLHEAGVSALMVLGGDGTHRAVVKHCGNTPLVAISSGTNNAFPPQREITLTALATGLFARGRIPVSIALQPNKVLQVQKRDAHGILLAEDIALVDVGVLNERILGARVIGDTDTLRTLLVTQASPEAVGLSAIAAMLLPLSRTAPGGLVVELKPEIGPHAPLPPAGRLRAALAPGLMADVDVLDLQPLEPERPWQLSGQAALLSFDGEREMNVQPDETIEITLRENAFMALDVPACLQHAAIHRLLLAPLPSGPP